MNQGESLMILVDHSINFLELINSNYVIINLEIMVTSKKFKPTNSTSQLVPKVKLNMQSTTYFGNKI